MEPVVRRCAGLDVHQATVVACVRMAGQGSEAEQTTRTFKTTTTALLALHDWLVAQGVSRVGMESTGVYWKPVYHVLEDTFDCWLVNAQHMHNVPGRKTDVIDAAWIAQLIEYGLVRPSFVPPKPIRELRELTRYRKSLIQEKSREAQRLYKVLEDAGIKLNTVVTDVLGKSGRAMLNGLIAGSDDPDALADLARGKLRKKLPALREALVGRFSSVHRSMAREMLSHLEYIEGVIERLSGEIERAIAPFDEAIGRLDAIPGVNRRTAEVLIAEIGADMSRFPSASHLASWAGLCPGNNESAGHHFSGKTRKGSRWLRQALVEAAQAAARTKNSYFSSQCARIKGRRGYRKAIVAVAHAILITAYHMLKRGEPYADLGHDYLLKRHSGDAYRRRLVHQLEHMGYDVAISPKAA